MKKIILLIAFISVSASPLVFADSYPSITFPEETFSVEGKLMNLELSDNGGVITVKGIAGKYGDVFLFRVCDPCGGKRRDLAELRLYYEF